MYSTISETLTLIIIIELFFFKINNLQSHGLSEAKKLLWMYETIFKK